MTVKLRSVGITDFGAVSKIIDKMQIRNQVLSLFENVSSKTPEEKALFDTKLMANLVIIAIGNYWKAEDEVIKLLASLSGKSVKEIKESPASETIEMLKELAKDKTFTAFLK